MKRNESFALKGMNQAQLSCLTSDSIQPMSFSVVKQNLDYLNFHVWGFVQMNRISNNNFKIASMGRKVLVVKASHEFL